MQLTKQANYALRTLVYCAVNAPQQSRISAIAHAYDISELSLFKFIKPLVDNGLLQTVRGRNGGVRLGRAASDITMREVIELTEDGFALAECFEDGTTNCPLVGSCEVNTALAEALRAFLAVLEKYTIEDLARRDRTLRDLLGIEILTPAG
ncbi:iron-responsive transcriptional regulator RirA [Mariluticola halotolerans]|uniref:iron-responsive transcriptional regulator RirA n=1 Tax=Mariluticola halotolerans TaxID=2909283 RepID=UPI0026E3CF8C|nr:iron-responsive transcriptional regulator RirA [Mariluticola halotolerans]UJQ95470.1 iron-responsive transcriptional regulator RirA [Mariluticola halotolerans]